mmetsp:Transcript_60802/g.130675  ORF Transcript_60802/g.130675 Transcript_60802/m.130675 type:complete len:238 (-) Transcript_60802:86-799(-)
MSLGFSTLPALPSGGRLSPQGDEALPLMTRSKKCRPLLPVIHSTKAFCGASPSKGPGAQVRDFYALAHRGYNPHESHLHMQARLGFQRPRQSQIRLRPLGDFTETSGLELELELSKSRKGRRSPPRRRLLRDDQGQEAPRVLALQRSASEAQPASLLYATRGRSGVEEDMGASWTAWRCRFSGDSEEAAGFLTKDAADVGPTLLLQADSLESEANEEVALQAVMQAIASAKRDVDSK